MGSKDIYLGTENLSRKGLVTRKAQWFCPNIKSSILKIRQIDSARCLMNPRAIRIILETKKKTVWHRRRRIQRRLLKLWSTLENEIGR